MITSATLPGGSTIVASTIASEPEPGWIAGTRSDFEDLRAWVLDAAYPVLASGPLGRQDDVRNLPVRLGSLEARIGERRQIPIVLIGETGVGKSTLLNSLLDTEVLPVGVIGSQTAAFVTIAYRPEWRVTCRYIGETDLRQIFSDAYAAGDEESETGIGELRDRARKKLRALLQLDDDQPLPAADRYAGGPPAELQEIVCQDQREFTGAECERQLELHARGYLWPLTRGIDVEGPFAVLRSGVVISDLPGAGDINAARVNRAAEAVERAGQVLIAADGRGLKTSLLEQLKLNRLPHRLLGGEPIQVVLVGTRLDNSLPDPEIVPQEVRKLGLDPDDDPGEHEIFQAVAAHWTDFIRKQFAGWLGGCASEILAQRTEAERAAVVARIANATMAIPTSAQDWKRIGKGKRGKCCHDGEETGIPRLRSVIEGLAAEQLDTTRRGLQQEVAQLEDDILDAIERSETLLGADIQQIKQALRATHREMEEVQDRFRGIAERLTDRIENASLRMRDQAEQRVRQHLSEPSRLHWMSLKATVRSGGVWTTGSGRMVNLRDAIGGEITALVPQAWRSLADEGVAAQMDKAQESLLGGLQTFCTEIRDLFEAACEDPLSRRAVRDLLQAAERNAASEIRKNAAEVKELRESTARRMQVRIDRAVDESLEEICDACFADSGRGWNTRAHYRIQDGTRDIASKARERSQREADKALEKIQTAVVEFCRVADRQMQELTADLPRLLDNAIEQSHLAGPQETAQRLRHAAAMRGRRVPAAGTEEFAGA